MQASYTLGNQGDQDAGSSGDLSFLVKDFEKAAAFMSRNKSLQMSNDQQLNLYGLFKQAQHSDCDTPKPSLINMRDRAKWAAWNERRGVPRARAMAMYLDVVTGLCPGWQEEEEERWAPGEALFAAVTGGDAAAVRAALAAGGGPGGGGAAGAAAARDEEGQTPLHFAADRGDVEVARALLEAGAELEAKEGTGGETPLAYAVTCEHEAVVRLLVSHGANIHASDDDGESILDKASPKIKAVLLESNL